MRPRETFYLPLLADGVDRGDLDVEQLLHRRLDLGLGGVDRHPEGDLVVLACHRRLLGDHRRAQKLAGAALGDPDGTGAFHDSRSSRWVTASRVSTSVSQRKDVVNIGALLRQHVDIGQVGGRAGEIGVELRPVDDQRRAPAQSRDPLGQRRSLVVVRLRGIENDQLSFLALARQRRTQREPAHFLGQLVRVVARLGPESHRSAGELGRPAAAVAGTTGTFLLVGLGGGSANLADALGAVGAGAAFGALPVDDAGEDVAANRRREDRVGELDRARLLVVEGYDINLHRRPLPRRAPQPPPRS